MLTLIALTLGLCEDWCSNSCVDLNGDAHVECSDCAAPNRCRPGAPGFAPGSKRVGQSQVAVPLTDHCEAGSCGEEGDLGVRTSEHGQWTQTPTDFAPETVGQETHEHAKEATDIRSWKARSMCSAAKAQSKRLGSIVREMSATAGSEHDAWKALFDSRTLQPYHRRFPEQNEATRVVEMRVPPWLRHKIRQEAMRSKAIEGQVVDLLRPPGSYHLWTLQFENAALFHSSCIDFMDLNRDIVKSHFPTVADGGCHCNLFTPTAEHPPYGLHHASSLGFQDAFLSSQGVFAPDEHRSFHTAITSTVNSTFPFVVFDDHEPEAFSVDYATQTLLKEAELTSIDRNMIIFANLASPQTNRGRAGYPIAQSSAEVRVLMDFLNAMLWKHQACRHADGRQSARPDGGTTGGRGTAWDLKPGQALFFNNWRAHGDHEASSEGDDGALEDRVTIDLRCFSQMRLPPSARDAYEFVERELDPGLLAESVDTMECLLRLLNYSSHEAFLETVYGAAPWVSTVPANYVVGSILLNFINGGDRAFLHRNNIEGARRHFRRVEAVFAAGLDFDGFKACAQRVRPWHRVSQST